MHLLGSSGRSNTTRGDVLREVQKREFFLIMDRGSTVRAAAIQVGVSPDVGYRWMRRAGLSAQRTTPRVYTAEEKAEFFRLLAEQGNAPVSWGSSA